MADISKSELARLLGDPHLGEEAYFLDVLSRWDSLRILDYLFTHGRTSTGDIARDINMDMREVRDSLDALADIGIVHIEEGANQTRYWEATTDEVHIALTADDGLQIMHTSQPESPPSGAQPNLHNSATGIFTRIGRRLDDLLSGLR